MPLAHCDMSSAQIVEVAQAVMSVLERVGEPQYASDGEDDGLVQPIVPGSIRDSRSGALWVNFGGATWYQYRDTDEWQVVLDADGRPLGVADQGPLVMGVVRGHPCAVTVDTGHSREDDIQWT